MSEGVMRVGTEVFPPFVIYDNDANVWSGLLIDILNEVVKTYNLHHSIYVIKSNHTNLEDDNLHPDDIIAELKDNRTDVALCPLWVASDRVQHVDFTETFYDRAGISILMLKKSRPMEFFKFLTILDNEVGFGVLLALFTTTMLMWLFERFSPLSLRNNPLKYKNDPYKRNFDLRECAWFTVTAMTPQGGGEVPKNLSGKLTAVTWWLFSFVVVGAYTANLAAYQSLLRLEHHIESIEDLSRQYKVDFSTVMNSTAYRYFDKMAQFENRMSKLWEDMALNQSINDTERNKFAVWTFPIGNYYKKLFFIMKENGFPPNTNEAIKRIRKEKSTRDFALIAEGPLVHYMALTNCDLVEVGKEFAARPYTLAIRKNSGFLEKFNNVILRLAKFRKLELIREKWFNRNPLTKNCKPAPAFNAGMGVDQVGGIFVLVAVGIAAAFLVLCCEYWWLIYRPQRIAKIAKSS